MVTSTWEARFWVIVGVTGIFWQTLARSIPAIFFMSAWALVKGALNQAQGAKREMLEEQASEES